MIRKKKIEKINKKSAGPQLRCRRVASKDPVPWHVWLASGVYWRAKLVHSCQSREPSDQELDPCARLEAVNQTRQMKTLSFVYISFTLVTMEPVCPLQHPYLHSELMLRIFSISRLCHSASVRVSQLHCQYSQLIYD